MTRQLTFLLTVFLTVTSMIVHGQTVWKTPSFDSTKHFAKRIYFILKDSTGKKDTAFSEIKYRKETTTQWDVVERKWETKSVFKNIIDPFYPKEAIKYIDSVYIDDKYFIEKFTLYLTCPGSDLEASQNNYVDETKKKIFWTFSAPRPHCTLFIGLIVLNQKGQKQELFIQIY